MNKFYFVCAGIGWSVNNRLESIAQGYELKLHPVVSLSLMGRINEGTLLQLPSGHPWARCKFSTGKPPSAMVTC